MLYTRSLNILPYVCVSPPFSVDLIPHLSQPKWAMLMTKRTTLYCGWMSVRHYNAAQLDPLWVHSCVCMCVYLNMWLLGSVIVFKFCICMCVLLCGQNVAYVFLHLMKRPISLPCCVLPECRCMVTVKEQWGLCANVCVCVSQTRHWQGWPVIKSARYSSVQTIPVT